MCTGYINSFREMRLNVKEEGLKEGRLEDLEVQVDKTVGILAKRQLRIEQQIDTKQSPLQRARGIHSKRQEEIDRMHSSVTNRGTEYKRCEKKLSKRSSSSHSEKELETQLEKDSLVLLQEDISSSSSISLPKIPIKKQTHAKRHSLPVLSSNPPGVLAPTHNDRKKSSLPAINNQPPDAKVFHKTTQYHSNQRLPPLK